MTAFTLAYLARLELWGLAAAAIQGGLVMLSWRGWDRALASAGPVARHRLAAAHFNQSVHTLMHAAIDHYLQTVLPPLMNGSCLCLQQGRTPGEHCPAALLADQSQ